MFPLFYSLSNFLISLIWSAKKLLFFGYFKLNILYAFIAFLYFFWLVKILASVSVTSSGLSLSYLLILNLYSLSLFLRILSDLFSIKLSIRLIFSSILLLLLEIWSNQSRKVNLSSTCSPVFSSLLCFSCLISELIQFLRFDLSNDKIAVLLSIWGKLFLFWSFSDLR